MDRQTIIAMLGEDVYASEGVAARRAAPHTGYHSPAYAYASTLPEEISALVWATPEAELDARGKIWLLFACYRDIPDYAWLSDLAVFHYDDFSPSQRAVFWGEVQSLLAIDDEALARPVCYMLWCDFFARQSRSAAAWASLAGDGMDASTTRRLLSVSGPVEFALKDALYHRLLPDPAWHAEIFRSLLMSWSDSFGHIDFPRARAVLAALAIPPGTDGLATLRAGLASELRPWERGSRKGAPTSNL